MVSSSSPEDVLSRSIFVKNVDYQATVRNLEEHFKDCGPIVRTTIKTGPNGKPLGFAYMEFGTVEAAVISKTKNDTILLGRTITVMPKRKNLPKPKPHYSQQKFNNPNPLMMQACAMMMAACSGVAPRGMPLIRGRGRGSLSQQRGRR